MSSVVRPQSSNQPGDGVAITTMSSTERQGNPQYLLGPVPDLLWIANLYWPLLFLISHPADLPAHQSLLFWQVYFVTAPHRWITLILIACDREKTMGREWKVLGLAGLVIVGCLIWQLSSDALLCLGTIDYLWNAWHFASQHHGILRIYERRGRTSSPALLIILEKWLFRGFLLYVIARVAGWGWSHGEFSQYSLITNLDWGMMAIPTCLFLRQLFSLGNGGNPWSVIYFSSVMLLYCSLLGAAHWERQSLTVQLALCSAVFHAAEYLAVVTWASTSTKQRQRNDFWGKLTRQWGAFLMFFVVFIGLTNYLLANGYQEVWILINLMAAFLHYAYDGMIWKKPKPTPT